MFLESNDSAGSILLLIAIDAIIGIDANNL